MKRVYMWFLLLILIFAPLVLAESDAAPIETEESVPVDYIYSADNEDTAAEVVTADDNVEISGGEDTTAAEVVTADDNVEISGGEDTAAAEVVDAVDEIDDGEEKDCIYYFYGENCPTCSETDKFIEQLKRQHPKLRLEKYEIYQGFSDARARTNKELLDSYFDAFDVDEETRGIPAVFLPRTYLVGKTAIIGYLEQQIKESTDSSCPSIGRRAVVGLVSDQSPLTLMGTLTFPVIIIAGVKDIFKSCHFSLLIVFFGLTYFSIRKKVVSRLALFLSGSIVVQFLAGLSVIHFGTGLFVINIIVACIALLCGIQIVVERLKNVDIISSFLKPSIVATAIRSIQRVVTSPPGALLLGALSTVLLLSCHGTNYLLLSSLIIQEASVTPVFLLFMYITMFIIPLLIVFGLIYRYVRKTSEKNYQKRINQCQLWIGWALIVLSILVLLSLLV